MKKNKQKQPVKVKLTPQELDKAFFPNVLNVIKGGNTIGINFTDGKWVFSFYFFDKGRADKTLERPGNENFLVVLNGACASFEEKPSGFDQNSHQEELDELLEELSPIITFLKEGEDMWLEKDEKYNYLFKAAVVSEEKFGKFSSQTLTEALRNLTKYLAGGMKE